MSKVEKMTAKDLKAQIRRVADMKSLRNILEGLKACLELAKILELEGAS